MEDIANQLSEPVDGKIPSKDTELNSTGAIAFEHTPEELASCRCGCVPPDLMSMFQMAALRAKYRENLRITKAAEERHSHEDGTSHSHAADVA